MKKTVRVRNTRRTTKRDPESFRPWEIATIIRAVNLDRNSLDLADILQVIVWTGLSPSVVQGIRWSDVHFEDHHLIARSARTLHTVCVPLPAPVLNRLRARHERYPNDECVFSSECLRESKKKLRELSEKVLGRAVTLEHMRDAKLNGWIRFNSKPSL